MTWGRRVDGWVCGQLARAGIRTPLFTDVVEDAEGKRLIERQFALCHNCRRVFRHWWGNMTADELKARGFLGCPCGGVKLDIATIPGWKACLLMVHSLLWRKWVCRRRLWDPRVPVRERDL